MYGYTGLLVHKCTMSKQAGNACEALTKGVLKSTELVNFSLDMFLPSCSAELPFIVKAGRCRLTLSNSH